MNKIPLAVLFGPTASGKTALAVEMAKAFNGEVITADSMQVYKGMDIGTAKPTLEEQQGVPHHMIDVAEPNENYSLGQYVSAAKACIEEVYRRGKLPILAGGTGLYIDTLIQNISLSEEEKDESLRKELLKIADSEGNGVLMEELKKVDPETANRLHINDTKRIVRALEVYKQTGIPQSEHIRRSKLNESPYKTVKFCITAERSALYERINRRVDIMFDLGLTDEVKALLDKGIDESCTSMQGLGYKEVLWYLKGDISLAECKDIIKQGTRRYAKRQVSWFKRETETVPIDMFSEKKLEIIQKAMDFHALL